MQIDITRSSFLHRVALLALFGCGGVGASTTVGNDGPREGDLGSRENDSDQLASDDPSLACAAASATRGNAPLTAGDCQPSVAARTFSSALCSCEDTNVAGLLKTRSFRSGAGAAARERLGGSVGVNRNYITGGLADVGGSFQVAGPRDVLFGGLLNVGDELRFNPSFDVAGLVGIGGDAHLNGALRAIGAIGIDGDLYRSPNSRFLGLALVNVRGDQYTEAVDVPEPCGCAPDELLDIAGRVAQAAVSNDNADVGLDEHALDLVAGIGTALTLPSGRYFLHQVGGVGAINLRISGKVELHVDDDFFAGPLFAVRLDAGAELDLFVRDNFVLAGAALLGDPARPGATRIYVGGTGDIAVAGLNAFAGNLYAPTANVLVGGIGKVYGSLFGKNILAAGILDVGYDETVRDGLECTPPGEETPPGDGAPPSNDPGDGPPGGGTPTDEPHPGDPTGDAPPGSEPPGNGVPTPGDTADGPPGADPCDPTDVVPVY